MKQLVDVRGWAAIGISAAFLAFLLLFPLWVNHFHGLPSERTHSPECLHNMMIIADALKKYAAEHSGRLPAPPGTKPTEYSWVPAVEPYIAKAGYDPNLVIRCPADRNRSTPSSYKMDPNLYGQDIRLLAERPDVPILVENERRHSGSLHTVTSDIFKTNRVDR